MGLLLSGIPLTLLLLISCQNHHTVLQELTDLQNEEAVFQTVTTYQLLSDVSAGDQIQKDQLRTCVVKVDSDSPAMLVNNGSSFEQLYAKTALSKGSILSYDMLYQDEETADSLRRMELTDLQLPENLLATDLLDIRIAYPNGEDYIVLTHQKIQQLLSDDTGIYGIALSLCESDILRLQSARVDTRFYENTYLYAAIYHTDFTAVATTNYPVNADVFTLMQWDPNIVSLFTIDSERQKRTILEQHLQAYSQGQNSDTIFFESE